MARMLVYVEIVLMGGRMDASIAVSYFEKLLNKKLDENSLIVLSSGQSARAHAWLTGNGFNCHLILGKGSFTINQLINGDAADTPLVSKKSFEPIRLNQDIVTSNNVGIDIQNIKELFPTETTIDFKSNQDLLGIFSLKELSYAESKINPIQTLAGIFAAKEAIIKASITPFKFNDLEILPDKNGKPISNGFNISISHSQDYAVAVAIPTQYTTDNSNCIEIANKKNKPQDCLSDKAKPNLQKFNISLYLFLVIILYFYEFIKFFKN